MMTTVPLALQAEFDRISQTVRIQHFRMIRSNVAGSKQSGIIPCSTLRAWNRRSYEILPRGGRTIATITLPDGSTLEGIAECSPTEPFNRKIGRDIATGRALKKHREMVLRSLYRCCGAGCACALCKFVCDRCGAEAGTREAAYWFFGLPSYDEIGEVLCPGCAEVVARP